MRTNATYRFLILTDHRKHKRHNSLYAIARTLVQHPRVDHVHIGSRGITENQGFFMAEKFEELSVISVDATFQFQANQQYFLRNEQVVDPADYDVILMRLPRPISDEFLLALSDHLPNQTFINDPRGILETSNKKFLLNFRALCPPMRHCFTVEEIMQFGSSHPIVLKPLKEHGGKGILLMKDGHIILEGKSVMAETLLAEQILPMHPEGLLAIKFMQNVVKGDKRILVVGKQIVHAMLRLPPPNSWICNVSQGGRAIHAEISQEEKEIIRIIRPHLLQRGIGVFGVDTLVNDDGRRILSEINTLSVGGFPGYENPNELIKLKSAINNLVSYVDAKKK